MGNNKTTKTDKQGAKFSFRDFLGLINQAKPKYLLLLLGVGMLMISASIQLYVPKFAATLINNFAKEINYNLLIRVVLLFIGSAILSAAGSAVLGIFGEHVIKNLRKILWRKLVSLKVKYFDMVKAGESSSRLVNDTSQVKQLLAATFPQTLSNLILIVGSIYMMFKMDWQMSLAMVVVVPLGMILLGPTLVFGRKIGIARQTALAKFSGIATEGLSEIRLVKTSSAEHQAVAHADSEIKKLFKVGRKEALFDSIMQPIMMMLMMSMIFGLLAYGMHRIATGEMQIGVLMSFLMYLFNLMGAIPSIAMLFTETAKAAGSTKRVKELLEEDSEESDTRLSYPLAGTPLSVNHLDFAYKAGDQILTDVSFVAKSDQIIAFAGPSGGGKSTIFSLIERFYEPISGVIAFDKKEISEINLKDYRRQIGFVSQDSAIMAGTIRENLTFGLDESFTDEQLWQVLEMAYARSFVEDMPDKLNTEVGERGVKISGGQRQRLAIARAFLRNPKLLMLDEATASLDSESEMMVQKALTNLMKGRTTLVIAHRLATIVDSDMIYFIDHGQVTGSGKHDELVKTHETYAKYVNEQLITTNLTEGRSV